MAKNGGEPWGKARQRQRADMTCSDMQSKGKDEYREAWLCYCGKENNMTQYILKERHLQTNQHSHFFDYNTLKVFGETMSGMRVYKNTVTKIDSFGKPHECYVLSSLQKKHPDGPTRVLHYFDVYTYEQVL